MQQQGSSSTRRRALRLPEFGPPRPNFVLTCPDCGHETGLLDLDRSWECSYCRSMWQRRMCRRCQRHLAMGEEGPFCKGALRCEADSQ